MSVMPIAAWLTLALLLTDVIARRSSANARQARAVARFPLWVLALPAIVSWLSLTVDDEGWIVPAALFALQLSLAVWALWRYGTWPLVAAPLCGVLVLWSGAIARQQYATRSITVGHRGGMDGGFNENVSEQFRRPELERFYSRMIEINSRGELSDFTCGDPPPRVEFELTLEPRKTLRERLVSVGYSPDLDKNEDRCLRSGLTYTTALALAEIDHGPRIDYGYTRAGKPDEPYVPGPPRKPICVCELRHSGGEWVAYSEEQAAELRGKAQR